MFYWRGLTSYVTHFVKNCTTCQASEPENVASHGLLQPFYVLEEFWVDISMDFISSLPKSNGEGCYFFSSGQIE